MKKPPEKKTEKPENRKKLIPQQKQKFVKINTQLLRGVLKKFCEQNKYAFLINIYVIDTL